MGSKEEQSNSMTDESKIQFVIVDAQSDELPQKICGLNVDCWHEIFEWLSLRDIHSVGETCTRLQLIAGDYFRTNFKGTAIDLEEDGSFKISSSDYFIPGFQKFIQNLVILDRSMENYSIFESFNQCKSLKNIYFYYNEFDSHKIELIKPILKQLEGMKFYEVGLYFDIYEECLKYCTSLNRLCVQEDYVEFPELLASNDPIIGTNNDWLLRNYPTLEHFKLSASDRPFSTKELTTFLQLNPNLKSLQFDAETFMNNIKIFLRTESKFGDLIIDFGVHSNYNMYFIRELQAALSQLYSQQFYNRLHLKTCVFESHWNNMEFSTFPGLKNLETSWRYRRLVPDNLAEVHKLKYIDWYDADNNDRLEAIEKSARSAVKLEVLRLIMATNSLIKAFIQYSPQLEVIEVEKLVGNSFDVSTLNREREKLPEAKKVTIYIEDRVYLNTIWASKMSNLRMIEIKRYESRSRDPFD